MANIGDTFIIEIEDKYESQTGEPKTLYRVKGFNSLVFDDHGIEKLKKVRIFDNRVVDYEEGANDAWALARKIIIPVNAGGYKPRELRDMFGCDYPDSIIKSMTYQEAAKKLEEHKKKIAEEENKIHIGDEITVPLFPNWGKCIVIAIDDDYATLRFINKNGEYMYVGSELAKKTGRSYPEIVKAMEALKNG